MKKVLTTSIFILALSAGRTTFAQVVPNEEITVGASASGLFRTQIQRDEYGSPIFGDNTRGYYLSPEITFSKLISDSDYYNNKRYGAVIKFDPIHNVLAGRAFVWFVYGEIAGRIGKQSLPQDTKIVVGVNPTIVRLGPVKISVFAEIGAVSNQAVNAEGQATNSSLVPGGNAGATLSLNCYSNRRGFAPRFLKEK